jgi:hypothetical protein
MDQSRQGKHDAECFFHGSICSRDDAPMSSREIGRIFRTPHWGKSPDTRVGFHPIAIMPVNTIQPTKFQTN